MEVKETLTKEEFCELTYTPADCWIFNGCDNPKFWIGEDERIYFNNGVDTIFQFKDMKQYGEIWISNAGLGEGDRWTMFSTWHVYD